MTAAVWPHGLPHAVLRRQLSKPGAGAVITVLELLLGFAAVGYVHVLVGTRTRTAGHAWFVRGLLAVAGAAVGAAGIVLMPQRPPLVAFLVGFGILHIPPAAVLFLKRQRPPRSSPPR